MNHNKLNRVSLALNALLVVMCGLLALRHPTAPTPPAALQTSIDPNASRSSADSRRASAAPREAPGRLGTANWIDVLRNQGVPERVIADLAANEFEDHWRPRQAEAQEAYNRGDLDADGLAALARQHDIEQENDLRARLGEEGFRRWDQERLFQQFNLSKVALTATETNSLYDLAANVRQRLRDLDKARQENEIDHATYTAEQAKAQADFEKQLRALLGDERYGALRGTDPTVGELRRSVRGLNVDDRQFALLLQAQQEWDTARGQLEQLQVETGSTNFQELITAVTEKRDQTFVSVLGTNGFALFQKQQDSRYLEMQKNAARWGLDSSNIDYVYGAIQTYEKAASEYERKVREVETQQLRVSWDVLHLNLQDYGEQLAQNLRTNLGEARYNTLSQNQILPFTGQ